MVANEWKVFISIVMPNVKPAWLTMIIFSVQGLWNNQAATFIYSEEKKTLVYALQQIQSGGIARTGQAAAVTGSSYGSTDPYFHIVRKSDPGDNGKVPV